jgi:hypothetical protein
MLNEVVKGFFWFVDCSCVCFVKCLGELFQNIQAIGKLEEVQVNYRNEVAKLLQDLHNIRNIKQVDSILTKHGI